MNKILLIIQREYVTRVRKKAFVIMTLLVPTLFAAMYAVIALVAGNKDQTVHIVNAVDNSGNFKGKFQDQKLLKFIYPDKSLSVVKTELKNENDLILSIPANAKDTAEVFSRKKTSQYLMMSLKYWLRLLLVTHLKQQKLITIQLFLAFGEFIK